MSHGYRTRIALTTLFLTVLAGPVLAQSKVGGVINGTVTWNKAGSPYVVTQDITISKGSTLNIDPGVVVRFKPNLADQKGKRPFDLEILVYGTLHSQGADGDSVYLTSDATDPTWGDWAGIILQEAGSRVILDRTNIEFANVGIDVVEGDLDVNRSTIRFCNEKGVLLRKAHGQITRTLITGVGNFSGTGSGIYSVGTGPDMLLEANLVIGAQTGFYGFRQTRVKIRDNLFTLSKAHGMVVTASSPEITGNTMTQNEYGLYLRGNSTPLVRDNNIFDNASLDLVLSDYDNKPDGQPQELDLSGNWWGRVLVDAVYDRIEDAFDNPAIGARVKIDPIRTTDYQARH